MVLNKIKKDIASSIAIATKLDACIIEGLLEKPKNPENGDLSFPCFQLSKTLKVSPAEVAKQLESSIELPPSASEVKATGPFLNFRFERNFIIKESIQRFLSTQSKDSSKKGTIVIDYSSPNIAKPFHVGHLRTTLIGNSLLRVYKFLGYKTVGVNHLGDWGTQFGFVWAGCKLWGKPEEESVKELVELYKKATSLKDAQEKKQVEAHQVNLPDVNEIARAFFLDLEEKKPYALEFWNWCLEISMAYLHKMYARLDVHFDHFTGESFYSDMLEEVKEELEKKKLLTESQKAFGVDLGEALGFARILTPDGRTLYLTRDIATAIYRYKTFQFEKSLYVVGAPQALHFKQLIAVLKLMGHSFADHMEHVAFGHVLGMKTRGEGGAIELGEFLDEADERALTAYREQVAKRPEGLDEQEVAKRVSLAAILYSNLSRTRIKDVHFSWEHALEFQGDSGPYLLYAYARINGIKDRAQKEHITVNATSFDSTKLTDEKSFEIAKMLCEFDFVLEKVIQENEPSHLTTYALDLARTFSSGYNDLKVVGEEASTAEARLTLFEATKTALGTCLSLLGIKPLERM